MAGTLTAQYYAQFRTIEQALQAASYAGVVGASDALSELDQLRRELEAKPARHWADEIIESEAVTTGGTL